MHGKTKHSWSTISSEHQVNRRSVNRRSNLIWLAMEKPDLNNFHTVSWCPFKRDEVAGCLCRFEFCCLALENLHYCGFYELLSLPVLYCAWVKCIKCRGQDRQILWCIWLLSVWAVYTLLLFLLHYVNFLVDIIFVIIVVVIHESKILISN